MRQIFSKFILVTGLLLCCLGVQAQHKKNYLFTRFGKVNGLAADQAFCVAQDKQGYIWIGTERGLQRYDGKRFITFRNNKNDPASLPSNTAGGLHLDKKGRLWIIFSGNLLGWLNTATFRYNPVKLVIPEAFKKNNMLRFLEDDDGTLHTAILGYGAITFNETLNEFAAVHNRVRAHDGSIPQEISTTQNKGEYLVTGNRSFDLYNTVTKQWAPRNSNNLLSTINRVLTDENALGPNHIFTDKKGRTWVDVWLDGKKSKGPQVYSYQPAGKILDAYKNSIDIASGGYHAITGILEQSNGNIWLHGTNLFAKLDEGKKIFEDVRNENLTFNGIELETIYQLFEDKDANLWISSTNGLYMFNPGKQVFSNLANKRGIAGEKYDHSVDAVLQSKSGIIYASAWGAGIFAYDSNLNVVPNPIIPVINNNAGVSVWDMHERGNGDIWLAEQGGGIRVYSPATKKTIKLKLSVFDDKTVRQVTEDKFGNMWMGTQYGRVIRCAKANWRDSSAFKMILDVRGRITKMVADKKGFIWICTDRFGLFKVNAADGRLAEHYDEASLPGRRLQISGANDVFHLNDSIVLIASGGLNILNTKTNTITVAAGGSLEQNSLNSIVQDKQGYLWLAYSDALARLEFGKNIYLLFETEDGILNNHFQINAAALLNNGRILLGTNTGLLLFDPAKIRLPQKADPVSISGFQLSDKDLPVDSLLKLKKITLPYYNNTFSIDLTTFNYHNEFAILYMLEGFDEKWIYGATQKATYYRLQAGTYTFKAKTITASGKESEKITELIIHIVPPFWETWWFYGLLIVSGLLVFYLADRERILRLKTTQKLRTDIALSLHHDVNTSLNNINLLSEMARMKADKDIAKSKELIEQISEKSNDMIIAMDDMLWVIDPANDSMEKTILRMNEFIDALRNRHEAGIVITIDEKVKGLKPDMRLRHGFFIIFKAALRCMVQYAGARQTLVNIYLQPKGLYLTMKGSAAINLTDNNICRHMEEMKNHAAKIQAELDIQNDKNECNMILFMPLK